MRVIHIQARCPGALSELSGTSERDAALAIETVVSIALLELCGEIVMDAVWIADDAQESDARPSVISSRHLGGSD